jgi:hypothetical protein
MKTSETIDIRDHIALSGDLNLVMSQFSYYLGKLTKIHMKTDNPYITFSGNNERKLLEKNEIMMSLLKYKLNDYTLQSKSDKTIKTKAHKNWTVKAWKTVISHRELVEVLSDSFCENQVCRIKSQVLTNLHRISGLISDIDGRLLTTKLHLIPTVTT